MTATCETCRFYAFMHVNGPAAPRSGACRRFPRMPVHVGQGHISTVLVAVEPGDWCGEHEPNAAVKRTVFEEEASKIIERMRRGGVMEAGQ